ncbi:Disease resistance RPP13-like protein 4 [Ananas comosus]|uniref:Disease resistance RPP13-like protein 4 n=1 Tax=Ananas comosus TaxID=4615 RepID=A0A199UZ80_ANACO|nr:Disease resistance RPP13-like protein 4 [Ananas comosus]
MLSQPQLSSREEEIQAEPHESIREEKMEPEEEESSLQAQSQKPRQKRWRFLKAVFNVLSLYWKRQSSSKPALDGQTLIPEEKREDKKEELHPEWSQMDARLEKILEEESARLLNREFNQLTDIEKQCLQCFSVFEPGSKIKKQIMIYWWIGEDFANSSPDHKTAEEVEEQRFQRLADLGFIEPIGNSCTSTIHECRVQPFVHWMIKKKAREASFCVLDETGMPPAELSKSPRLCLTSETELSSPSSVSDSSVGAGKTEKPTVVVFNVSKQTYRSQLDEFLNIKSLVVLQLGRWHGDAKYHIEVEGFEDLNNIGLLTNLRYLGLQGLSGLTALPPKIKELKNLLILDLRGCQYLEKVGKYATYLKRLTRLDLTECYLLEHITGGFGSLSELQVFKGFVFGGSRRTNRCRLKELSKLRKLRKLSINITSDAHIEDNEMTVLSNFSSVLSLTITWGEILTIGDSTTNSISKKWKTLTLPPSIEKFDMRCFPYEKMPNWFDKAQNLKRLYIRGGILQTLDPEDGSSATGISYRSIERLRLKYLDAFDMEWSKIRDMMPKLDRLELVKCEKLKWPPPLDQNHVWIRDEKDEEVKSEERKRDHEETDNKPEDLHGSPTTEATTETFAASKEENITETTHRQTPTDKTSPKFVVPPDEIITAEPALQDLSAASTSAVANPTNNSSTNAATEAPSNPSIVPATSPPGATIGDGEGNP